ncbi:hypothetical protein C6P40_001113 [Pichia californica]|uniref:Uncharacterized protein n=1 Tax=Pichia californica TaxID=460514 RepID=A0A9P7BG52_9ASCO|nr:hypothetical protein C6P42_001156 [[Candida] californica]KAG0688339.1 hypothetical protein C6P40_001113 [[Candida] californica]
MTESPAKATKSNKSTAKKGPFAKKINSNSKSNASRRFSIISNSEVSDDSDDSDDDSDSSYDDHIYLNRKSNKSTSTSNNNNNNTVASSSSDDEEYSSSSDDENVDFVQLTKQRRFKAMKAVKKLKNQMNSSASPDPTNDGDAEEVEELDDDLVDAVIENEERKMKGIDEDIENTTLQSDNLENIDFDFSIDEEDEDEEGKDNLNTSNSQIVGKRKDVKNVLDQIRDEDIGEVIEDTSKSLKSTKSISSSTTNNTTTNKPDINKIEIDVPKFNDKEINSDADYEFDNDDLIQTLLKDNDDLELHNSDSDISDNDDFDYLIANHHKIDHTNLINKTTSKDLLLDSTADDAYLMKEETQAMLDDFDKNSKFQSAIKNRRSSMYYQNQPFNISHDDELDDLDLDLLNNFEQFLPKQQAMRRRSSILNQTILSSSDSDSEDNKRDKKISKKKLKKLRKLTNNNNNSNNTNIHTKDIRQMLGITDSNFTSNFTSNAIVDSDDDTKLLEYIFEDSESENEQSANVHDGNETDEDLNIPKKSTKSLGSKHAKEILSSSKDQFRAPKLGTFITKKPYSVIDGFTTRFLHPVDGNLSILQKAASLKKFDNTNNDSINNNNNSNIALDELINISEFDEDYSNADSKEDFDEFFGDKRIPLTAFRNKGLNVSSLSTNNPDISLSNRKFSFNERNHRKKLHKSSSKLKSSSSSVLSSTAKISKPISKNMKNNQYQGALIPKSPTSYDSTTDSNININENDTAFSTSNINNSNLSVDEVLLIGVESLPLNESIHSYPHDANFEITAPHQFTSQRKRKSISRSSKARIRRASMVEAHAEGLRQTKNGLFDENVMDDVEALLIDMGGDVKEYGFLFGNDI